MKWLRSNAIPLGLALIIAIQLLTISGLTNTIKTQTKTITAMNNKLDTLKPPSNDKVIEALTNLQDQLVKYRNEQSSVLTSSQTDSAASLSATLNQALATLSDNSVKSPYTPLVHIARLKAGWNKVDAYSQPKASSRIVGQAVSDQDYVIDDSQTGWYDLRLDSITNGWVQAQFVNEIN